MREQPVTSIDGKAIGQLRGCLGTLLEYRWAQGLGLLPMSSSTPRSWMQHMGHRRRPCSNIAD